MDVTIGLGGASSQFMNVYRAMMIPFQVGMFALLLVGCGAMLYALYQTRVKPRVWPIDFRVLDKLNNSALVHDDFARPVRDEQGLVWWQLKKARCKVPPAPYDALLPTNTGRKSVIAEKMELGQYRYLRYNNETGFFDVLTSNQKSVIVDQVVKAELKRKTGWKENLPLLVSVGGIVIIVAMSLIFIPQIMDKWTVITDKMDAVATKQIEMLDRLDSGERGVQRAIPAGVTS
jgi:hypothetical protein